MKPVYLTLFSLFLVAIVLTRKNNGLSKRRGLCTVNKVLHASNRQKKQEICSSLQDRKKYYSSLEEEKKCEKNVSWHYAEQNLINQLYYRAREI